MLNVSLDAPALKVRNPRIAADGVLADANLTIRVSTDMGGPNAPLSVEDSIAGVVDAIVSQAGQSGLRVLNRVCREVPR